MSKEKTLELINKAINAIDNELSLQSYENAIFSNANQLYAFKDGFEKMRNEIENRRVSKTQFGIGHAIIDSWPLDSILGELLIRAEQAYLKL